MLQSGIRPIETMDMELKAFEDELPNLYVREDDVLCHYDSNDGNTRIVILLHMMHNDLGHFGFKKTVQRIKDTYFWPLISSEIEDWCRKCEVCQRRRNLVPTMAKELHFNQFLHAARGNWLPWILWSIHKVRMDTAIC